MSAEGSALTAQDRRRVLEDFDETIGREAHNLSRWPELLWQQLYNRIQWKEGRVQDVLRQEHARRTPKGSRWLRTRTPFRESEALIRVLTGHTAAVHSCAINPVESLILSAGADGTVRVWDTDTGQERATLRSSAKEVWCCAFSPDGSRVAAGDTGGALQLWDSETGDELATLRGGGPITSCAFSPDGSRVVYGSWDGLRMWDASRRSEAFAVDGLAVSACAFSPDGTTVTSGGLDCVELRSASSGAPIRTLTTSGRYSSGRISSCAYSPDGSVVASTNRHHEALHLWDVATGELRATLVHGCPIYGCCWSPDGRFVIAALNDQTLRISDAYTGQERATLQGHAGTVFGCAAGSTASLLVSASMDGTLRIWDTDAAIRAASTGELPPARLHKNAVRGYDVSPDGSFVVSTSRGGTIAICDAESGDERVTMDYVGGVEGCAVGPDGSLVVTAHYDGRLVLSDAQTGEKRGDVHCVVGGIGGGVRDCAVSRDGSVVVGANGDGTLKIWDANSLWGTHTWGERGEIAASDAELYACAVSPDCSFIVSASYDGTAKIWDARTWRELASLEGHKGAIMSCAVSPDGSLVVSASLDRTVKIWDAHRWRELTSLEGHTDAVVCCAFSPDGRLILSSSEDRTLRFWSPKTKSERAILALPGGSAAAVFHPWRPRVFCGGRGGDLYSVELVGFDYGPIVVTAEERDSGLTIRCPKCWQPHPLNNVWLGQVIDCPTPTCDLMLRVNPFVLSAGPGPQARTEVAREPVDHAESFGAPVDHWYEFEDYGVAGRDMWLSCRRCNHMMEFNPGLGEQLLSACPVCHLKGSLDRDNRE